MLDIIKHYLKEEDYFISFYKNYVYFYKYEDIVKFTDKVISVRINNFIINIKGDNLCINKMEKLELLISGNIMSMEKYYE